MNGAPDPSLWAALPVPAMVLSANGNVAQVNSAAEIFFNLSERSMRDKPLDLNIFLGVNFANVMARVLRDQSPAYLDDIRISLADQGVREANVQLGPLVDGVLILVQPKSGAERLGRVQGNKAARQAIGMAEMLAHEIKNPLAGITGAAQLLSMNLSEDDQELTDLIVVESKRIVTLLDQVERFGDLRPPECKVLNIHDILDRARRAASVGFARHMKVIDRFDPSLPQTFVDGDQIMQVFLNILKNASEASDGEGKIEIRTYYDAGLKVRNLDGGYSALPLQVEIIDNGPGLPDDLAEHVFDPFVSGKENGTGLGLALVSKIINDHNTLIAVDSIPGRTVFRVSLPLAPKEIKEQS